MYSLVCGDAFRICVCVCTQAYQDVPFNYLQIMVYVLHAIEAVKVKEKETIKNNIQESCNA